MSFFNSLVNQVGREVGRDIYRTTKYNILSAYNKIKDSSSSSNYSILKEINNFEFSVYDKHSIRRFQNITDKLKNINPESFDWDDVYEAYYDLLSRFESRIGDKADISDIRRDLPKLFNIHKDIHVRYLKRIALKFYDIRQENQNMVDKIKSKNKFVKFFMTLIGLNSLYADFGQQKLHSVFSLMWVMMASLFYYYGFSTGNIGAGVSLGLIAHSVPFLMARWLRPKSKTYQEKVDDANRNLEYLNSQINMLDDSEVEVTSQFQF